MTSRSLAKPTDITSLDRSIADAESGAMVVWRGERIAFPALPERIARIDDRHERDRLFSAYLEALEALNPRYEDRLQRWASAGEQLTAGLEVDPVGLAADLERFVLHSETPYYAALRRYLALIDIEQGDATVADVWHIARGATWTRWFGAREVRRAVAAVGRDLADPGGGEHEGWLAAEDQLGAGSSGASLPGAAVGAAYRTLAGSPEWAAQEIGVAAAEVVPYVDFAAFVRLWRIRRAIGELQYELRLSSNPDPALARAYYSGIVGHMTGVMVPEAAYLHVLSAPFESAQRLAVEILAADLVEVLEGRYGPTWWRSAEATGLIGGIGATASVGDALAQLGYDALDWRPLLRQIRTRLIGEMSGYGGPNITTRAGTRKV
jgi:hypothetical protein